MSIRLHMKYPPEHTEAASSMARGNYRSDPANVKIDNPIMSEAPDETETFGFYHKKYRANMQGVILEVQFRSTFTEHRQKFHGFICRNTPGEDSIFLESKNTIYIPHKITGAIEDFNIYDNLPLICHEKILRNKKIPDTPNTFNLTFNDYRSHEIKIYGFELHFADADSFPEDAK
jgi:hypothetical protein